MATKLHDAATRADLYVETHVGPLSPEWVPMTAPSLDINDTASPPKDVPVTLVVSFETDAHPGNPWLKAWSSLGRAALRHDACRDFRILQDRRHGKEIWVVSEWRDSGSLNRFAREMQLPWIERSMAANLVPVTFRVLRPPEGLPCSPVTAGL